MSFQNTCGNIWNFKLTIENRKQVLRDSNTEDRILDLDERAITNAANRGWKNMLNWINADKDDRDRVCDSIVRRFE